MGTIIKSCLKLLNRSLLVIEKIAQQGAKWVASLAPTLPDLVIQKPKSPLFMQYHQNQPFNENYLRLCPLLDNPGRLTEMVEKSGAKSTDMLNPEDVHDLSAKCEKAAEHWSPVAESLWRGSHSCAVCAVMSEK